MNAVEGGDPRGGRCASRPFAGCRCRRLGWFGSAAEWKKNSSRCQGTEAAGVVATAARILAPHHARQQLLQSVARPTVVRKAQLDEEEKAAASRDHGAGNSSPFSWRS
ncbi:unnamed protein product [Sphagnum troendelagicum]|uniref:Uncharacterized protein n=1 Tax=Sphagnum troendelagicum TaxID=128251 RepID=A0ABP0UQR8_9BRYO